MHEPERPTQPNFHTITPTDPITPGGGAPSETQPYYNAIPPNNNNQSDLNQRTCGSHENVIGPFILHQKQYAAECGLCAINHLLQKNTFNHQEILKEAPGIVDYVMDMPEGFMKNHDQHYNQEGWYSIEILVCLLGQAKMRVELSSPIGQKSEILLYPEVIGILVKHAHPSHYTAIVQIENNIYHIDSIKERNQGGIVELTEEGYQSIVANPTNHSYTVTKISEQPLISPLTPPRRQDNNNNDEDPIIITQIDGEAQNTPPRKSAKTHEKD